MWRGFREFAAVPGFPRAEMATGVGPYAQGGGGGRDPVEAPDESLIRALAAADSDTTQGVKHQASRLALGAEPVSVPELEQEVLAKIERDAATAAQFFAASNAVRRDLPAARIVGIEGINGTGKSTLALGTVQALRQVLPEKTVVSLKGSGNDPRDPLTQLTDLARAYPDQVAELAPIYEAIVVAQKIYAREKIPQNAFAIAGAMWQGVNILLERPNTVVVMDRTPWSAALSVLQGWKGDPERLLGSVEGLGRSIGGIPFPHQLLVDVPPEIALARLSGRGDALKPEDAKQLTIERRTLIQSRDALAQLMPGHILTIDGNQPPRTLMQTGLEATLLDMMGLPRETLQQLDPRQILAKVDEVKAQDRERIAAIQT